MLAFASVTRLRNDGGAAALVARARLPAGSGFFRSCSGAAAVGRPEFSLSARPIRTRRVDIVVPAMADCWCNFEARMATIMTKRGLFARCALGIVLATTAVSAADSKSLLQSALRPVRGHSRSSRAGPPPENGDGLVFPRRLRRFDHGFGRLQRDGRSDGLGAQLLARDHRLAQLSGPRTELVHPFRVEGATIYYVKVFVTPSKASTLAIEYPAERKTAYDRGIITRASKSFTPGQ